MFTIYSALKDTVFLDVKGAKKSHSFAMNCAFLKLAYKLRARTPTIQAKIQEIMKESIRRNICHQLGLGILILATTVPAL
ncbi:MAG: hypothetical protein ACE5IR_00480, partial [bacterium]